MRIAVLGAGAWGTALAKVLHENGNAVIGRRTLSGERARQRQIRGERQDAGKTLAVAQRRL